MKTLHAILLVLTCILNFSSGQYSICRDAIDSYSCYHWLINGMCSNFGYRSLMIENCQKTCNFCPVFIETISVNGNCVDKRKSCVRWKNHCNEYSKFYNFMTNNCQRACLFCEDEYCIDKKEKCGNYRDLGYCQIGHRYYQFMKNNCEKSCQFCKPVQKTEVKIVRNYVKEFQCDFEKDECDWSNQYFEDTSDWATGVDINGPTTGFNNSESYLYLDTKYKDYFAYLWIPWELTLPTDEKDKGKMCLHFMYQMNGGKIVVNQKSNPTLSNKYPAATLKYSTAVRTSSWTHAKVNVYVSDRYHLILKGIKGHSGSYIAIDHMYFTDGECS